MAMLSIGSCSLNYNNDANVGDCILRATDGMTIPAEYNCNFCNNLLINPVQFNPCGHHYCRACSVDPSISHSIENENGTSIEYNCCVPDCMASVDNVFDDNALKLALNRLPARCPVAPDCVWSGELSDVREHVAKCQYVPMICVFSTQGCKETPQKKDFTKHFEEECTFRMIKCPQCGLSTTVHDQQKHLEDDCPEVEIECEHETCRQSVRRKCYSRHCDPVYGDCCAQTYPCTFSGNGIRCVETIQMTKKERDKHDANYTTNHVRMLAERCSMLEITANKVFDAATQSKAEVDRLGRVLDATMRTLQTHAQSCKEMKRDIEQYGRITKEILKKTAPRDTGGEREETSHEYANLESLIYLSNTEHNSVLAALGEKIDKRLKELENRLSGQTENSQQYKDAITVEHVRKNTTESPIANDGIFIWKITGFTEKVKMAGGGTDRILCSPIFYTSRHGYNLCLKLYPNGDGDGKDTHISLFLVVMKGEFDALLTWPFKQRVTFMLLDHDNIDHRVESFRPDPRSSSYQRPQTDRNKASGFPKFCSFEQLTTNTYIRDDCTFIKLIVGEGL